jgi:hypothetical protein
MNKRSTLRVVSYLRACKAIGALDMVAAVLLLLSGSTAVLHVSAIFFLSAILLLLPWKKPITFFTSKTFPMRQR